MTDIPIEIVAVRLLGPCESVTTDNMLVYNGGNLLIDAAKGKFIDVDKGQIGDAVELVMRQRPFDRAQAEEWISKEPDPDPNQLPSHFYGERELIGLVMSKPSMIASIEDQILPEDFGFKLHGMIYRNLRDSAGYSYGMDSLLDQLGGDPRAMVVPSYTLSKYIAHLVASAPIGGDEYAKVATLAQMIRQAAQVARGEIDEAELQDPKPRVWKYGPLKWSEIDQVKHVYRWLIKGIAPLGQTMLLAGHTGSGKSFMTIDAAMHVARGLNYLGRKTQHMGVAYCFYEAGDGASMRLRAYKLGHEVLDDDLPFIAFRHPPQLYAEPDAAAHLATEIIDQAKLWKVPLGLIIVDTHNAATRGSSEVKSEDISKIILAYEVLRKATGAALWIVGHTNADGNHRGNQQFYNGIETGIFIQPVADRYGNELHDENGRLVRTAILRKQREGQAGLTWQFVLKKVVIGTDEDGGDIDSCILDLPALSDDQKPKEKRKRTPGAYQISVGAELKIFTSLLKAIHDHGEPPPAGVSLPASVVRVAKWADVCTAYRDAEPPMPGDSDEKHLDRLRQRLRRAQEKLTKENVIGLIQVGDDPTTKYHVTWPTGRRVEAAGFTWPTAPKIVPISDAVQAPQATDDADPF